MLGSLAFKLDWLVIWAREGKADEEGLRPSDAVDIHTSRLSL